jgi:hypothetical protein
LAWAEEVSSRPIIMCKMNWLITSSNIPSQWLSTSQFRASSNNHSQFLMTNFWAKCWAVDRLM